MEEELNNNNEIITEEVVTETPSFEETNNQDRIRRIEDYLLDPEKTIFDMLSEFEASTKEIKDLLRSVDLGKLQTLAGVDGVTPIYGVDYMNEADISAIEGYINAYIDGTLIPGVSFPTVEQVGEFIASEVLKIPRIKGDKGDRGAAGKDGRDGSPDTAIEIADKLKTLDTKDKLRIVDIKGLEGRLRRIAVLEEDVEELKAALGRLKVPFATGIAGNGGAGTVTSIDTGTGLTGGPITSSGTISLSSASIASLAKADTALQDISGLISAGTNVTITGSGTSADPYVINASGGGGGGMTSFSVSGDTGTPQTITDGNTLALVGGTGIDTVASATDTITFSLDSATQASLLLADSAVQNLVDLGITATSSEINILDGATVTTSELNVLDGITATTTELNYVDGVTSAIQTQLDAKQATITGGATTIVSSNLTASRALVSNSSGKVAVSSVTETELGYVSGVTSAIQTQISAKADDSTVVKLTGNQSIAGTKTFTDPLIADNISVTDSAVPTNGMYLVAANTLAWAINSVGEMRLTATALSPNANDGNALGTTSLSWSDLFLASGGVINIANGNWVATHTSGILTVGTGDLRVTTAGTNAASVLTSGGTQTVDNKIINKRTSVTTSASSLTPDWATVEYYEYTALAADFTLNLATNMTVGSILSVILTATGSNRTFTANPGYDFVDGNDAPANIELGYQYEFIIRKTTSYYSVSWTRIAV